jgi:hypothetical protein
MKWNMEECYLQDQRIRRSRQAYITYVAPGSFFSGMDSSTQITLERGKKCSAGRANVVAYAAARGWALLSAERDAWDVGSWPERRQREEPADERRSWNGVGEERLPQHQLPTNGRVRPTGSKGNRDKCDRGIHGGGRRVKASRRRGDGDGESSESCNITVASADHAATCGVATGACSEDDGRRWSLLCSWLCSCGAVPSDLGWGCIVRVKACTNFCLVPAMMAHYCIVFLLEIRSSTTTSVMGSPGKTQSPFERAAV